ncbi:hypothetical protein Amn_24210 [Aminobacter sp. Y103A]|nr:hypothetical protein Amn_24210 [Aminobacter sp. SS-2016]
MTTTAPSDTNRPHRGRRMSWEEFYRLTDRKPPKAGNDNEKVDGLTPHPSRQSNCAEAC